MTRLLRTTLGLAVALAVSPLVACTPAARQVAGQGPRYASLDATLDPQALSAPERRASPVAVLPAWIGRPIRLREHDDADRFEQAVSLSLAPRGQTRENVVIVAAPRSREAAARLSGMSAMMAKPSEAGIRSELEAGFPGIPMQVVTRPASNAYGPYGLAVGHSTGGARCLYAWQWIEEAPSLDAARGAPGPLSVRIRLCRSDITLEAMAAAVNQMRLVPRFEGTPVDRAAALPHTSRTRHVRTRQARPAEMAERRAPAALPHAADEAPAPDGRRYLGADTAPASRSMPARAALASDMRGRLGGTGPSAAITADLPPEAYRGPSAAKAH